MSCVKVLYLPFVPGSIYSRPCPLIRRHQRFVYGSAGRPALVAVTLPNSGMDDIGTPTGAADGYCPHAVLPSAQLSA